MAKSIHLTHAQVFKPRVADDIANLVQKMFNTGSFQTTEEEGVHYKALEVALKHLRESKNEQLQEMIFIEAVTVVMRYMEEHWK